MARKFLYGIAIIIGLVIVGAIVAAAFQEELTLWAVTPPDGYEEYEQSPTPDYGRLESWAARPDLSDSADLTPDGIEDAQATASADVFFIHPTTFLGRNAWNAPYDDPTATDRVDDMVMRYQASAYNGCCRIFAPYYRQATLGSFFKPNQESGQQALNFAYEDVRRAFRHYIKNDNKGRPFVLAAHSQGSWHLVNLLRDEIVGMPLMERMVAAYPIGYAIPEDLFGTALAGMSSCKTATETGCMVTWSTFLAGGDASDLGTSTGFDYGNGIQPNDGKAFVCVNPLSWTTGDETANAALNLGAIPATPEGGLPEPETAIASAQCLDGVLYANLTKTDGYTMLMTQVGNLHVYDYNLFYMNLRQNAAERVNAFTQRNTPAPGPDI